MKNLKEISRIKWAILWTFGQGENQFLFNLLPENNDENYTLKIKKWIWHFFVSNKTVYKTYVSDSKTHVSPTLVAAKKRIQIKSVSRNAVFTYLQNTKKHKRFSGIKSIEKRFSCSETWAIFPSYCLLTLGLKCSDELRRELNWAPFGNALWPLIFYDLRQNLTYFDILNTKLGQ